MTTRLILLALACVAVLTADPVQVTFQGTGSGTLGTESFTDSNFVVSLIGDYDDAVPDLSASALWLPGTSATFSIGGIGSGNFTETIRAFVCLPTNECAGFADTNSTPEGSNMVTSFIPRSPGVGLYDYKWKTDFGPENLMVPGGVVNTGPFGADTTSGELIFTGVTALSMEARVNPVPEPTAFELLGMVILACAALSRSLSRKPLRRSA